MMNADNSRLLSIIAYYLSEYGNDAAFALGYPNRAQAIKGISEIMGRKNNYLKFKRDEFDALPDSSSPNRGWKNRPPAKDVVELASYLRTFSFDELTKIAKSILNNQQNLDNIIVDATPSKDSLPDGLNEEDIERIINYKDEKASVRFFVSEKAVRVCNFSIIVQLKSLYKWRCQICGNAPFEQFNVALCEAHHIEHFVISHNNNAKNIIILCPNHHRLMHKLPSQFDRSSMNLLYPNGQIEHIVLNQHL